MSEGVSVCVVYLGNEISRSFRDIVRKTQINLQWITYITLTLNKHTHTQTLHILLYVSLCVEDSNGGEPTRNS